jgi:hypothetical protein
MKKGILLLILTAVSSFSYSITPEELKEPVFEQGTFPFAEITYYDVIEREKFFSTYSHSDISKMVYSCQYNQNYVVDRGNMSEREALRYKSCILFEYYLSLIKK